MSSLARVKIFGQYVQLPFLVLAFSEAAVCYFSVYAGIWLRLGGLDVLDDRHSGLLWPRALLFAGAMMVSIYALGLYQPRLREGHFGVALRLLVACLLGGILTSIGYYAMPAFSVGRGAFLLAVLIAFLLLLLVRSVFIRIADESVFKRRILVFGSGKKALSLAMLRRRSDQRGFRILGYLPVANGKRLVDAEKILDVEGSLPEFAAGLGVTEIVVAVDDRRLSIPVRDLLDCRLAGIQITDIITFFERESGKVRLDLLYPSWLIFSEGFSRNMPRLVIKRLFDLFSAFTLLVLALPVMLLVAILIKVEDGLRAPVFYRQIRVGLEGNLFEVLKFRSMVEDAERDNSPRWATKNDSRVTKVGNILRILRIDELPQFVNVLRGEMAIVGPRPERPEFVEKLVESIPYYQERHCVKPGITGWAQLQYPYGASDKDAREKLQFDLYYVKNHSLLFDLQILAQTVEVVLFGRGAR